MDDQQAEMIRLRETAIEKNASARI